jgi:hypothetical protein
VSLSLKKEIRTQNSVIRIQIPLPFAFYLLQLINIFLYFIYYGEEEEEEEKRRG